MDSDRHSGMVSTMPLARAEVAHSHGTGYGYGLAVVPSQTPVATGGLAEAPQSRNPESGVPTRRPADGAERYVLPNQYDQAYFVHAGRRGSIRLRAPILRVVVSDEDRDGVYVVSDTFSTVYGAGETIDAAFEEYVDQLFLQFDELERDEERLAPGLRRELDTLREYFVRES